MFKRFEFRFTFLKSKYFVKIKCNQITLQNTLNAYISSSYKIKFPLFTCIILNLI